MEDMADFGSCVPMALEGLLFILFLFFTSGADGGHLQLRTHGRQKDFYLFFLLFFHFRS
jgi:hypothetical protein